MTFSELTLNFSACVLLWSLLSFCQFCLHARNIALEAGARPEEVDAVVSEMIMEGKIDRKTAGPKILYSLEMGVELGVKALLLYHGIDFPKTHNVVNTKWKI